MLLFFVADPPDRVRGLPATSGEPGWLGWGNWSLLAQMRQAFESLRAATATRELSFTLDFGLIAPYAGRIRIATGGLGHRCPLVALLALTRHRNLAANCFRTTTTQSLTTIR